MGGRGREAAVPSRGSAGAIRGLERPLLAPGSRRNNLSVLLILNFLGGECSVWAMGKQNYIQ